MYRRIYRLANLFDLSHVLDVQVDALWAQLQLAEVPEQSLAQFSSCLLAVSPDLSHSVAAALIRNLLLDKVPTHTPHTHTVE